jgi:hypothetical protein
MVIVASSFKVGTNQCKTHANLQFGDATKVKE